MKRKIIAQLMIFLTYKLSNKVSFFKHLTFSFSHIYMTWVGIKLRKNITIKKSVSIVDTLSEICNFQNHGLV